ncbi:peptidylprolyl isomerase [Streptomyces sp. NPDC056323]|uniref:peptidylprolyl isomerase n=1 Tax=Streptomyces sp. NPDC056323 TaxID=3345784 RepID=UPI0035D55A6F
MSRPRPHATSGTGCTTPPSYKDTYFHSIEPHLYLQGGKVVNGALKSEYISDFDPENLTAKHDKPGLLTMVHRAKNPNNTEFMITLGALPMLDGEQSVFGEVVDGMDVVRQIEKLGMNSSTRVRITDCSTLWVPKG